MNETGTTTTSPRQQARSLRPSNALKSAKKAARLAPTLPEKLDRQRTSRTLEAKREDSWRAYDQASREIDRQKDALLDEISRRLEQRIEQEPLFALRWHLA
jgi:hypothetical protein